MAEALSRSLAGTLGARVLSWNGDPATCPEAARAESADRIVMGRGRGRIGRLVAGSASATTVDQADCAVHIVTADAG
jgi:nucleotide-binding universal stress UspA family protein